MQQHSPATYSDFYSSSGHLPSQMCLWSRSATPQEGSAVYSSVLETSHPLCPASAEPSPLHVAVSCGFAVTHTTISNLCHSTANTSTSWSCYSWPAREQVLWPPHLCFCFCFCFLFFFSFYFNLFCCFYAILCYCTVKFNFVKRFITVIYYYFFIIICIFSVPSHSENIAHLQKVGMQSQLVGSLASQSNIIRIIYVNYALEWILGYLKCGSKKKKTYGNREEGIRYCLSYVMILITCQDTFDGWICSIL